jgi:hypothetical protein
MSINKESEQEHEHNKQERELRIFSVRKKEISRCSNT